MEYPLMLFKGGDITAEWRIVPDQAAEKAAQSEGFLRAGTQVTGKAKKAKAND